MNERRLLNLLKIIEPLLAVGLWASIYSVRLSKMAYEQVVWSEFVPTLYALGFLTALCFWRWGLYQVDHFMHWQRKIVKLLKANSVAFVGFVFFLYFFGERRFSRISVLSYFLVSSIAFILLRGMFEAYVGTRFKSKKDLQSMVFCGPDEIFLKLYKTLNLTGGWNVRGWVEHGGLAQKIGVPEFSLNEVKKMPLSDIIVLAFPTKESDRLENLLLEFDQSGHHVKVIPAQRSRVLGLMFDDFYGLPLLSMNTSSMSPSGMFLKRVLDLFGSAVGIILLSPFLFLLALFTKITSPGPIFYSQYRIGQDGKKFKLYKFRTMKVGSDKQSQWTVEGDSRTTAFGAFLRKTSLDELPQLWNILKGEMSVVGPRPEQPNFVDEFKKQIPNYMLRHRMKAGLTGWAQVHGLRGDTDIGQRIEYDLEYIRMWSIWLDIKIILLTFYKGIFNRNAY